MDNTDELLPIDTLAYITEELQGRFRNAKDATEKANVMKDFLCRWEADTALEAVKTMPIVFEKDLDWFNVTQPLTMDALHGKLVILDFFTYCCINCMHILPELHALEQLYPVERGLAVVGVHSPKFENEKDAANILSAAQRYGITHAIVNDPRSSMWRSIGIRCWPSLLILSPSGAPMLLLMGEGHKEFLQHFTEQALRYFDGKKDISYTSLPLRLSTSAVPASHLRFPAKICAADDGRFAIADAGNHRILVIDGTTGVVQHKIGGCDEGFLDGDFASARFNSPQGVAFLNANVLVVADTENHALRQITLSTRRVETLAGTGQQGCDRVGGKLGPLQPISSPWDVAVFHMRDMDMSFHLDEQSVPEKTIILIAMAGTHQIWGYFPDGIIWWKFRKFDPHTCVSLVGNGLEENRNNSYPQNAGFAQPSGLAMAKDFLFIADSESSSVRKVAMVDGKVTAVVGGDRNPLNLFAYGDIDGKQYNAKLQHPLGVCFNPTTDRVYVADTYNNKIKCIDHASNTIETVHIKDESTGTLHQFKEPAGLCFNTSGQQLFISDTNNHQILCVNMQTLTAKPFALNFSQVSNGNNSETDAAASNTLQLLRRCLPLQKAKAVKLNLNFTLVDGLKFTAEAPQKWSISSISTTLHASATAGHIVDGKFNLQLQRGAILQQQQQQQQEEHIKLDIALSLCDTRSCLMKRFALIVHDDSRSSSVQQHDTKLSGDVLNHNVIVQISQADIKLS